MITRCASHIRSSVRLNWRSGAWLVHCSRSNFTLQCSIPSGGFAEVEEGAGDGGPGSEEQGIGVAGFGLANADEGGGGLGVLFEVSLGVVEELAKSLAFVI